MAEITQALYDKLALAQSQTVIGYIGITTGVTGMTRAKACYDENYRFYDSKKIHSLIKNAKVERWAKDHLPAMFITVCANAKARFVPEKKNTLVSSPPMENG